MARKRRSPPPDGAGPSRPTKREKSTSRSVGPTSAFSETATGTSPLELEAINRKMEGLKTEVNQLTQIVMKQNRKIGRLQMALKEKLNILPNPPDTNQSESEQEDHGRYKLKITGDIGDIKNRVFTDSEVEGPQKVAIYCNDDQITSGPLASAKFEVLVINSDFCASVEGDWSAEKFQGSLVKARKEVGSILKDNYISQLSSGEAVLNGLIFKDNSSWATEKQWRLGIRLLESNKVRVLEAISDPFRVWDRHGKVSEKQHPPLLTDGVECIKKVGNKRALALKNEDIRTVKGFLQLFHINQSRLLEILRIKSDNDQWKTMIGHAKECDVGSDLYSYKWKTSMLFFDSVYNVVGAEFGNCYRSIDKLKVSRKTLVNKRKIGFYEYLWKKDFYKDTESGNFIADFEMVNGQPVPIEHNVTSISTYDDAQQNDHTAGTLDIQPVVNSSLSHDAVQDIGRDAYQNAVSQSNHNADHTAGALDIQPAVNSSLSSDAVPDIGRDAHQNIVSESNHNADQTAGALNRQPADITRSFSYDSAPNIRRDTHQNIVPDHNGGENYSLTQDENLSQVQEQESAFVALNSTVETNSTSTSEHENMGDSLWEPYQEENMEGPYKFQNVPMFTPERLQTISSDLEELEEWVEEMIVEPPPYETNNNTRAPLTSKFRSHWYRAVATFMAIRRLRMLLNTGEHHG